MTLRHAIGLALVVWYLMVPPFSKTDQYGNQHADPGAPLSKWEFYTKLREAVPNDRAHALEFRTWDECERKRKDFYDGWFGSNGRPGGKDIVRWDSLAIGAQTEVITYEKCVSSEDPRLQGK